MTDRTPHASAQEPGHASNGPNRVIFAGTWFVASLLLVLFRAPAVLWAAPAIALAVASLAWKRWREALLYLGIAVVIVAVLYGIGYFGGGYLVGDVTIVQRVIGATTAE